MSELRKAMKAPQYTPTGCLLNAIRRDKEKGGDGLRSTREVAQFCGLPVPKARNLLWKLVAAETVDVYDGRGVSGGEGDLWKLRPLTPGMKLKVIRSIGAQDTEVEATLIDIVPSCVLPVQVQFEDGWTTGYLHQEIREIVA